MKESCITIASTSSCFSWVFDSQLCQSANDWVKVLQAWCCRDSANAFGHDDVVAGNPYGHVGCEWGGAGFNVAEVAIEGGKGRAGVHDAEVDGAATRFAKVVLGGIHQFAAQACALAGRVHAEQAQVATVTAKFDIDAAGQTG